MTLHTLARTSATFVFLASSAAAVFAQPQSTTVDSWLKQLKSDSPTAIAEAAAELRTLVKKPRLGQPIKAEEQQAIVTTLVERLADKNHALRRAVIQASSDLGIRDKALLAAIARATKDADAAVQLAAHGALWTLSGDDESFKAITAALNSPAAEARINAISAIEFADNPKTLAALLPLVKDPDDTVAMRADVAVHRLCGVLRGQAKAAVPLLIEQLLGRYFHIRRDAAIALGSIGVEAKAALPTLIRELKKPDGDCAETIAWAIGRIASGDGIAVSALTDSLASKNSPVRREAAMALATIGPSARPAVVALRQAADDDDANVRVAARLALWRILNEDAQLKRAIDDAAAHPNSGAIINACSWLTGLEPPAELALLDQLKHPTAQVREIAATFVSLIDPPPKNAVPALVSLLQDPEARVRSAAAQALLDIDSQAAQIAGIK